LPARVKRPLLSQNLHKPSDLQKVFDFYLFPFTAFFSQNTFILDKINTLLMAPSPS
jgi:hypothetical protein